MENLHYKAAATGAIRVYRGKGPASRLAEELPMSLAERHRLRHQVDRKLVVAAKLIFGRSYVPADINELVNHKALVYQVLKDCPTLLVIAYVMATQSNRFSAKPVTSVIKRMKDVFMRKGYVPPARGPHGGLTPGRTSTGKLRKPSDVNAFWDHYADNAALTEAGWRYLQKLPLETKTEMCLTPWYFYRHMPVLNALAELQFDPVDPMHFALAQLVLSTLKQKTSSRNVLLALRNALEAGHQVDAAEEDYISDLLKEYPELVVQPGTAWKTLVDDAEQFLAAKAEGSREELAALTWTPPIGQFTTAGGVTLTPLRNGIELLEEGIEMKNCLRNMTHYAKRAIEGSSFVCSMRGAHNGTAEFSVAPGGEWSIQQVAIKCNRKVFSGPLWVAAEETVRQLNKESA